MREPVTPTRRGLFRLLAGVAAWPALARAASDEPQDRGIGGTGARPPQDETPGGDRGIGGTGVIGTIRRFGSIVVNDLRIAYPDDVAVRIDGAPATVSDLRVGHVVRVVAEPGKAGLSTRAIEVTSEVVGPVEAAAKGRLTVLGQSVATSGLRGAQAWKTGERVAVSGLRRADGTIVASLIEARPDGAARVAGPVGKGPDGVPTIAALKLTGLDAALVGRRAAVEGTMQAGTLAVTSARDASRPFAAGLRRTSIEAYVGRSGDTLRLGSGLSVAGRPGADIPATGSVRAVLTTGVARDGQLTLDAVRVEGRSPGSGPGGTGPGGGGGPAPGGSRGGPDVAPNTGPGRGGQGPPGPPSQSRGGLDRQGGRYGIDTRTPSGGGGGPGGGGFGIPGGGFGGPGAGAPRGGPGGFGGPSGDGAPGGFGGGGGPGGPGGFFGGRGR